MQSHPLKTYARQNKVTLAQIAVAAKTSRMTLHRVIRGQNTTLDLLGRISDATDGAVSVQALVAARTADACSECHEKVTARLSQGAGA